MASVAHLELAHAQRTRLVHLDGVELTAVCRFVSKTATVPLQVAASWTPPRPFQYATASVLTVGQLVRR
jgi:hypothetical protein